MKNWIMVFLKGMGMGAADVIPGVSGGTIAFITGIYERLITAIKSVNWQNIKLFFTGHFKEFWKNIDGTFLLFLIAGIVTSFLSLAKLMTYLLENQPVLVWAFFFGLIMASTIFIGKDVKWNWKTVLTFVLFAVLSFFITSPENQPLNATNANWYIFLCGAIAICAMILPGISGSFILVLLGEYLFMLSAIANLNIVPILIFMCGAVIGLLSFANLLSWLFKHFKMITLAALTGFMLGSLNKIWPWKETLSTYADRHGVEHALTQMNVLPASYSGDPQILWAVLLVVFGFALIFIIEFIAKKLSK
ncbi:MAG: DUF368 domain-containing protein [Bacteroidales bacterium]|nr:DUF368 domain-containing protein [Bacteroidales bacterium]